MTRAITLPGPPPAPDHTRNASPLRLKIEALEIGGDCVFVPRPDDKTQDQHQRALSGFLGNIKRKNRRQYKTHRTTVEGVPGIVIWRVEK